MLEQARQRRGFEAECGDGLKCANRFPPCLAGHIYIYIAPVKPRWLVGRAFGYGSKADAAVLPVVPALVSERHTQQEGMKVGVTIGSKTVLASGSVHIVGNEPVVIHGDGYTVTIDYDPPGGAGHSGDRNFRFGVDLSGGQGVQQSAVGKIELIRHVTTVGYGRVLHYTLLQS